MPSPPLGRPGPSSRSGLSSRRYRLGQWGKLRGCHCWGPLVGPLLMPTSWRRPPTLDQPRQSSSPIPKSQTLKGGWRGLPHGGLTGKGCARRYAPLAYARTKGAFHVQPAMAVTQSRQKSSAKSKSKAQAAASRRSSPTAQERLVQGLIELMQQGVAPWRKPWDGSGGGHHCNLISGHRYRGSNPILLTLGMHIRCSALPFWCGYAEAKGLGISPKKGSKAALILRPQVHQQAEEPGAGRREQVDGAEGGSRSWVSYRPVAVFKQLIWKGRGWMS